MKAFLSVMVDCGAKRLEVAARAAAVTAMFGVGRAGLGIDFRQLLVAPKLIQPFNSGLDLELLGGLANVGQVDREHVGAVDVLDVLPAALRLILSSDVAR